MAASVVSACSLSVTPVLVGSSPSSSCSTRISHGECRVGIFTHRSDREHVRSLLVPNLQAFWRGMIGQASSVKQHRLSTIRSASPDLAAAATASKSKITPLIIKDANIVAVPQDDKSIRIRVDIDGQASQRAFDAVLKDLAKHAPPVPGFRRSKGGKTANVPLPVFYQLIGPKLVRKFVVEEIVKSTLQGYIQKEGIEAKVVNSETIHQSNDELETVFEAGKPFGFDATLDILDSEELENEDAAVSEKGTVQQEIKATV